ncbi:MAG: hypothetical protein QOD41_3534 [Cryptosporangiaceae bacterium]|nr:hypothetical protein [Cryptosporangiaceae bacterium]
MTPVASAMDLVSTPSPEFTAGLAVADAVLFEGYLLYPYRASAQKNQLRWQFGVLNPRAASEAGTGEPWASQTECVIEGGNAAEVRIAVRFLQVERRIPADPGEAHWDEGVVRTAEVRVPVAEGPERVLRFGAPGDVTEDPGGGATRLRAELTGLLRVTAVRFGGPYPLWRLRLRVENVTDHAAADPRDEVLRHSLVAAHTLIAVRGGAFVSLLEPPEWAAAAVAGCQNQHTWPVLVGEGERDLVLSSPIILYDHPAIAPESMGQTFDGTEIDEILTLRTMTLTEEEKRAARATDPRAAALIERADSVPGEVLERLHGAIRQVRHADPGWPAWEPGPGAPPWWDPGADSSVSPEHDRVTIGGVEVGRGSEVVLRPGLRGTDAQDMFLTGRTAIVEAVLFDVDGGTHVAVTLPDDPMAELQRGAGRFLYFSPAELEPVTG